MTKTGGTAGLTNLGAPGSVLVGAHESDDDFFWFAEKKGVAVVGQAVDLFGTVTGTVNSYMVYTDKKGTSGSKTYDITIKLSEKILGVITSDGKLNATDGLLGLGGTSYPTGVGARGQESPDTTSWNVVGNELTLHHVTFGVVNEIRVLTAVPEPALYQLSALLTLGGLGLLRLRRRR